MSHDVLIVILHIIIIYFFVFAFRWQEKEMIKLAKTHPERFDENGCFIPYKTDKVNRPNFPINAPKLPDPRGK